LVTPLVFLLAAAATALQYVVPGWTEALARRPDELLTAPWRLLTALFVHVDGTVQIVVDFAAIAIVGTLAEWIFGRWRWLVLYFGCGILAGLIALAWEPSGGGSSIASAGLLGGLAGFAVLHRPPWPFQPRLGGAVILALGFGLAVTADIHGPPILAGALLGLILGARPPAVRS
jgi:rhomboid protease GluP